MPDTIKAAGGAMSGLTRRSVLTGIGTATVTASTGTALAVHRAGGDAPLRPEVRINAAIAEIEEAMREMHPTFRVGHTDNVINFYDGSGVMRHGILIFGSSLAFGPEIASWFVQPENETLLPADVWSSRR